MTELTTTDTKSNTPHTSPARPTHRITRSITEISSPTIKSSSHRPHLSSSHHHHYHNSRRARSSEKEASTNPRDREPQSAHPNLLHKSITQAQNQIQNTELRWRDGAKSEFGTPAESRRASGATWDVDVWSSEVNVKDTPVGVFKERKIVKEGEVKEERERGILRAGELRTSLQDLNTLSNDQTSRLDITYYAVLEKLSFLQSSISSLQQISQATRSLAEGFTPETSSLAEEITEQIEAFDEFSSQSHRIADLTARVQTGRGKIKELTDRVVVIRDKVEGYEQKEKEWQDKTRRRLRFMWMLASAVCLVFVGLVLFRYTPAKAYGPGVVHGVGREGLSVDGGGVGNVSWSLKREVGVGREGVLERLKRSQDQKDGEDERLRVFDEL